MRNSHCGKSWFGYIACVANTGKNLLRAENSYLEMGTLYHIIILHEIKIETKLFHIF